MALHGPAKWLVTYHCMHVCILCKDKYHIYYPIRLLLLGICMLFCCVLIFSTTDFLLANNHHFRLIIIVEVLHLVG